MKFSYCLMNPPYSRTIHLKFLENVIKISNKVVSIQPAGWILGCRRTIKLKHILDNFNGNIEIIDAPKYFDAGFLNNVTINFFDTTNKGKYFVKIEGKQLNKKFNNFSDISLLKLDDNLYSFSRKIRNCYVTDNLENHIIDIGNKTQNEIDEYEQSCLYGVRFTRIRGNINQITNEKCADFYTIISNNDKEINNKVLFNTKDIKRKDKNGKSVYSYFFLFNTKREQLNFFNYIRSDFCRACLATTKNNQHLDIEKMEKIPWFDFNEAIFEKQPNEIDYYLFSKYGITNAEILHIYDILPNYYNIDRIYK